MNNRWCILGSPRSGSTRLIKSIFDKMPVIDGSYNINLHEFFHQTVQGYYTTSGKNEVYKYDYTDDFRASFRKDIFNIMNNEQNIGFTLKVFFDPWHGPDIDYVEFLKNLEQYNFKFIKLNRELFDKVLSMTMSEQTNIWHRYTDNPDEYSLIVNKKAKISISLSKFAKNYYFFTKMYDYYCDLYSSHVKSLNVSYKI